MRAFIEKFPWIVDSRHARRGSVPNMPRSRRPCVYSPDPRGTSCGHRARRPSNYMWSSKTDKASAQMSDAEEAWQCKEKKTAVKFLCIQCDRVVTHLGWLEWWSISSILNGILARCQSATSIIQNGLQDLGIGQLVPACVWDKVFADHSWPSSPLKLPPDETAKERKVPRKCRCKRPGHLYLGHQPWSCRQHLDDGSHADKNDFQDTDAQQSKTQSSEAALTVLNGVAVLDTRKNGW